MASSPLTYDNIKQVPLVVKLNPRDSTLQQDAWMKNVFIEKGDEGPYSVKRAGLKYLVNMTAAGLATYQFGGMGESSVGNNVVYDLLLVYGVKLMSLSNAVSANYAPLGTLAAAGQLAQDRYRFVSQPVSPAAGLGSLAFVVFQGSAYSIYTYGRQGNGLQTWPISPITTLVPSLCLLDNTWYCLDYQGRIWASAIGDPTTWPALNSVQVDAATGTPSAMWRHQNYLVCFGTTGIACYYDAAISPGAPIAIVPNGIFRVGMPLAAGLTLAELEDTTFFLGESQGQGFNVYQMSGTQIQAISTPAINRILDTYASIMVADNGITISGARPGWAIGTAFKSSGQTYYVLTFPTYTNSLSQVRPGVTLAYSMTIGEWFIWTQQTGGVEAEWQIAATGGVPNLANVQVDRTTGLVYTLDDFTYQDNGQAINVFIQTDLFNWGNQRIKLIPATYPLLDIQNSTVSLSWTDNDYQTFSTPQVISTVTAKKQLIRCGSTVQRAWRLTHTDNTPMRFYQLELEVVPGAL